MCNTYYVTTPIYYVNDVPHIGHAYTTIACDVIARFMRLADKEVIFLTGTDEHGQKVEKSALAKNITTQELTDTTSLSFQKLMHAMNISNNDFIRTTEERHKKAVTQLWRKLQDSGNIYLDTYSGWYCTRDEAFYKDSELTADGQAPTGASVEWVEESSYFFALSKWQDKLLEFYDANPNFILPNSRRNEVISFVKSGLEDLSISRTSFRWGVPVPDDDKHIIYVWLDALTNYISALGYNDNAVKYKKFWPADVHVVGKDILRFHAVYWPAFLMAAELPLPKCIMAHGWWTNDGQKISKSLGNVIDPFKLVEQFGLDSVRYFLMREITFGNDGNYLAQNLIARVNAELSNKIGNLLQRTLAFIHKNHNGTVPNINRLAIESIYTLPIVKIAANIVNENIKLMDIFDISSVISNILSLAEKANVYIDQEAPWQLKNTDSEKMSQVLYTLLELIRYIAIMLQPFTPDSAAKMLDQLNINMDERSFKHLHLNYALKPNSQLPYPSPIFPKLEQ